MAVLFWFSAQSDLNSGLGALDLIGRKIVHVGSYALLTWLWFRALRGTVPRPMLSAAVIAFTYAITDEYHQHFVHGRHGSPIDVLIDSVGIAAIAIWQERRRP